LRRPIHALQEWRIILIAICQGVALISGIFDAEILALPWQSAINFVKTLP
jgi:hypothetical protein